eukprot:contig_16350_g3962
MGGLGKSTTLQLVCARLADTGAPDGEHVFRGGSVVWVQLRRGLQEAETKLLLLQATSHLEGRVVSDAGGVWHAASLLGRAAAAAAHDGRPCLLVLDDVWDGCLVPALLSELRDGATGGTSPSGRGSLILFSTRVAAMATGDADITHLPLEGMSAAHGLQVLAAAVAGERHVSPTWATPDEQVAARKLVEYAAGHPLTLSVAGALTRAAMAEDDHGGGLVEALQQLRYNLQAISARTGGAYDSRYSSLWASLMASYEALPLDARFRYRALAVVRSRGRLPLVALGALWGVSAAQALSIAKEFANRSMAALRRGGAGGAPTGAGGGGGPTLEVHDLQLQFAAELCAAEEGGVAAAHEALLRGYARVYDLEPAEQVHPWWTVLREDPYLRGELCRHLASAGRATELRRLLFTWAYVEAQVGWAESPPSSLSIAHEAPGGWAVTRELHMQHRWASPILCLMGGVPLAGVTGGGLGGATSTEIAAPTVAVVQDVSGHGRGPATHILVGHDVRTGRRVCDVAAPPNVSCATVLRRAAHGGRIRGRAPPTLPPVLAVGDDTGGLTLWDPSGSGLSARVGAHKEGVTALVVVDPAAGSSQPPVLVSAARDGTLAVWHKALGGHAEATSGGPMFSVHACVGDDGFVPGCPAGWDAQGGGLDGGGTALLCTSFVDGSEAVSVRPWAAARDSAVVLSPLPAGDRITSVAVAPLRLPDGRCSPLVAVRTTSEQVWVWQGTAAPAVELGAGNRFLTVQSIPGEGAAGGDGGPSPLVVALTSAGA